MREISKHWQAFLKPLFIMLLIRTMINFLPPSNGMIVGEKALKKLQTSEVNTKETCADMCLTNSMHKSYDGS